MNKDFEYWYKAIVVSVYDGDSITIDVDYGFDHWEKKAKIRLSGIDTPELRGADRPEGLIVRDYVRNILQPGTEITINTIRDKSGKYGRYLARVWVNDMCLNDHLLEQNMATKYE